MKSNHKLSRNSEIIKSPFVSQHSNSYVRQESSMDAKTSRWKFDGKQDIYIVSKYLPTRYLLIIKVKNSNFLKPPDKHLLYQVRQEVHCNDTLRTEHHLCSMPAKNAEALITMRNTKQAQTEGRCEISGLSSSEVLSQDRRGNAGDELLWIKEDHTDEN